MRRKWELSRRTFLRGAGVAMALPMMEAMMPQIARAQAAGEAPPRRLLFYYVPCGIYMPGWTPAQEGYDYDLPSILAPLADYQEYVTVLSGVDNHAANAQGDGAGDHARGTGSSLTCTHVNKSSSEIINGVSVDQVAASALAHLTTFRSLELGIEPGGTAGSCDSGYSCAYSHNIAWSGPSTPVAKEIDPEAAFNRLFSTGSGSAADIDRRKHYKQSVLDAVLADAQRLQSRMGYNDNLKLDEYLNGVRELEIRVQNTQPLTCDPGEAPTQGIGGVDYPERILQMSDIMALAYQCDLTRVISFMQAHGGSNRVFPFLGIPEGHHYLSHHGDNPDYLAKLETIGIWESQMLAYLLGKLKATIQPDGTNLLDNMLIWYSSEIADGNSHAHNGMPILLIGKGGGEIASGRHIVYGAPQPQGNLFISMLKTVGVDVTGFGDDGTGELEGLTG